MYFRKEVRNDRRKYIARKFSLKSAQCGGNGVKVFNGGSNML